MIAKKNNYLTNIVKKNTTIAISNNLARTFCNFTLAEWKVVMVFFGMLNKTSVPYLNINKKWFFNTLNISGKNRNANYQTIVKSLIEKTYFSGEDRVGVLVYQASYKLEDDYFEVWFNPVFMRMIQNLKKQFTVIAEKNALKLTSKQDLSLFLYFSSFRNPKKTVSHTLTTEQIKIISGIDDIDYLDKKIFKDHKFEQRKIQQPLLRINKTTDLKINYIKHKSENKESVFFFTIN